jgi:hypothetical protein
MPYSSTEPVEVWFLLYVPLFFLRVSVVICSLRAFARGNGTQMTQIVMIRTGLEQEKYSIFFSVLYVSSVTMWLKKISVLTILFRVFIHIRNPVLFGHDGIDGVDKLLYLRMVIMVQMNAFFFVTGFYGNKILVAARQHDARIVIDHLKRVETKKPHRIRYRFADICRIQGLLFFLKQVPAADPKVIICETVGRGAIVDELRMIVKTQAQYKAGAVFFLSFCKAWKDCEGLRQRG